jgi:hypothetical protein
VFYLECHSKPPSSCNLSHTLSLHLQTLERPSQPSLLWSLFWLAQGAVNFSTMFGLDLSPCTWYSLHHLSNFLAGLPHWTELFQGTHYVWFTVESQLFYYTSNKRTVGWICQMIEQMIE